MSLPSSSRSAAPLHSGCGGVVNSAVSSRYSQNPANSRLAKIVALSACARPPWPTTYTSSSSATEATDPRSIIGHVEPPERQDEAEAGREVVRERVAFHDRSVVPREPDRRRLGDQVADGEDEPVLADHDAVARAIGAEDRSGERIVGNLGAERDDAVERRLEVEGDLALGRLQCRRECPAGGFGHEFASDTGTARHCAKPRGTAPRASQCYRYPAGGGTASGDDWRTDGAISWTIASLSCRQSPCAPSPCLRVPRHLRRRFRFASLSSCRPERRRSDPRRPIARATPDSSPPPRAATRPRSPVSSRAGANVRARDGHGRTPLIVAALRRSGKRCARWSPLAPIRTRSRTTATTSSRSRPWRTICRRSRRRSRWAAARATSPAATTARR